MKTKIYLTKKQVQDLFIESVDIHFIYTADRVAIRTAWNDFTDMLCKDGKISQKQYDTWQLPRFVRGY